MSECALHVKSEEMMEVDAPQEGTSHSSECTSSDASSSGEASRRRTVKDEKGKYNLRTSSLINRIQTERKRAEPKNPKPKTKPPPLSKYRRKTANARERTRMQEINQAYEDLRQVVPQLPEEDGKSTKITTLRLALNYIAALREILGYEDLYESESSYLSRSPSTSGASDTCSSPSSSISQGVSPPYPNGEFSDGGPITPGTLDSEGESLVSSWTRLVSHVQHVREAGWHVDSNQNKQTCLDATTTTCGSLR